jgi:hypothetical protein
MMLKITIPTECGNRAIKDGSYVSMSARKFFQSIDCFERIAFRRQCRRPLVRIKETELTHPRLPNHAITHKTRTGQWERLFFEVPYYP